MALQVGASETLGTVIEGESLLNDGTAFVFFLVFRVSVCFTICTTPPAVSFNRLFHIIPLSP